MVIKLLLFIINDYFFSSISVLLLPYMRMKNIIINITNISGKTFRFFNYKGDKTCADT